MSNEMTTENMSNEEVIEVLKGIVFGGFDRTTRKERQALDLAIKALEKRPQGECKDCDKCEDKALSYSMGLKDGYLLGGFQLTELRRWLTSQGYSEGTVDDKINEFTRFVEKIRGKE